MNLFAAVLRIYEVTAIVKTQYHKLTTENEAKTEAQSRGHFHP